MRIADAFEQLIQGPLPLRFTAYDGSASGPEDAPFGFDLRNERGLAYLMTAPGDLGLGRAYVSGDLVVTGVHPGDPYEGLKALQKGLKLRRPSPAELVKIVSGLGISHLKPPTPPQGGDAAAVAPRRRGRAPLADPRQGGDPPPLRRLQHVLRVRARAVDDLHLRGLPDRRRDAGAGAALQVRPRRPQARPPAGHAAARRRLRLGRDGAPRGPALRRQGARRDPVA